MKKKLLFLLVCTLLLLLGVAAPALADGLYYNVNAEGYGGIVAHDETGHTLTEVTAIPAGATVTVGYCWIAINRGLAATEPYAWRQRVTVTNSSGGVVGRCDESDCQSLWSPLFRWNEQWSNSTPDWLAYPYNPKVAAGMWARCWFVQCGALPAGDYTVSYNDMLTRKLPIPMMDRPGAYRPLYPAHDWREEPVEFTFTVG